MRVTLKLFASLSPYLPPQAEKNSVGVEAAEGETISSLLDRFSVPRASRHLVLLNGLIQHPSQAPPRPGRRWRRTRRDRCSSGGSARLLGRSGADRSVIGQVTLLRFRLLTNGVVSVKHTNR
jgi:sulfur-carrier protein